MVHITYIKDSLVDNRFQVKCFIGLIIVYFAGFFTECANVCAANDVGGPMEYVFTAIDELLQYWCALNRKMDK